MADMYTLKERIPMEWSLIYQGGTVQPFFTVHAYAKTCVRFVDLYDKDGVCRGSWSRPNMHYVTARLLDQWCDMTDTSLRVLDMRDWSQIEF